jgi:hypothetical protein
MHEGLLCMETLPVLYDRYQGDIDPLVGEAIVSLRGKYRYFESEFLNKIPRGTVKDKKVR